MRKKLTAYREEAMKPRQIIKSTFRTDRLNTRWVYPTKMEVTTRGYKFITVTKKPKERARIHKLEVRLPRDYTGKFNACPAVKVDCDCERYLFVWNYALNKAGAAIKDRTNGEAPDVTNPQGLPGICKHGLIMLGSLSKLNPSWPQNRATRGENSGQIVRLATLRDLM